eukprot:CAMPEP_0194318074 /NCGR_PEP_ID=MMETSP0171-20130528/14717_1 /TAXON_ID=218684 /ORGANISM="Corethron pennatum, Strain L29A3" /LENGTH=825 /DNA_ID=CAMNT_0039074867 /DNA_START=109 /DNA_END=2586 /DNA_ORIENTATION=-
MMLREMTYTAEIGNVRSEVRMTTTTTPCGKPFRRRRSRPGVFDGGLRPSSVRPHGVDGFARTLRGDVAAALLLLLFVSAPSSTRDDDNRSAVLFCEAFLLPSRKAHGHLAMPPLCSSHVGDGGDSTEFDGLVDSLDSFAAASLSVPQSILSEIRRRRHATGRGDASMSDPGRCRQRICTGRYPLYLSTTTDPSMAFVSDAATRRATSATRLLVNGTVIERSTARADRAGWLDEEAYATDDGGDRVGTSMCFELVAEISAKRPAYLNLLPRFGGGGVEGMSRRLLWITDFSLLGGRTAGVTSLDPDGGKMVRIGNAPELTWPNEVCSVPRTTSGGGGDDVEDALLVADGFLVPGRDDGGIYVVLSPGGGPARKLWGGIGRVGRVERTVRLTGNQGGDNSVRRMRETVGNLAQRLGGIDPNWAIHEGRWFYHKAVWVDLTGDGRLSILTARAQRPHSDHSSPDHRNGQLVWLERPAPHHTDAATGQPRNKDGTPFDAFASRHTPWRERILDEGPDVMFNVADLDPSDNTIEVIAAQFFGKKVTLHSIERGPKPRVTFSRTLDDTCGASYSAVLVDLGGPSAGDAGGDGANHVIIDSGSSVETPGLGDTFTHLLVTSHECTYVEHDETASSSSSSSPAHQDISAHQGISVGPGHAPVGGSLFAYAVPPGADGWRTDPWVRTVVATGFCVRSQLLINPGAPGFCYVFYPTVEGKERWGRPYVAISGDCAERAYVLRPAELGAGGDARPAAPTDYELVCEIDCGATVGSLAIGYDDFCKTDIFPNRWAKIYVPSYEKDKILVFALSGVDEDLEGYNVFSSAEDDTTRQLF